MNIANSIQRTLILLAANSAAYKAVADDLSDLSIEELLNTTVYTASRFPQKSSDAPAAVTILTAQDIETYGYTTLADALASVRGLHGLYDRNYEYLGIRGLGRTSNFNNRFLLLIDGYRMNDAIYENASIGRESLVDLNLVERIEIIHGPGSAVHGSNAFLGVINVITKKGRDFDGWQVSLEGGSHGTLENQITYGKRFDNDLEVLLSGTYYESEGQDSFHFKESDFQIPEKNFGQVRGMDEERFHNLHAKVAWGKFTASAAYIEREKDVPTASFGAVINQPIVTTDRRYTVGLAYETELGDHLGLSLESTFNRYDFERLSYFDRINEDLPPFSLNLDESSAIWWHLGGKLDAKFGRHRLITGFEYQNNEKQHLKKEDIFPAVTFLDVDRDSSTWAIYVEDEFRLSDRVLLNAGIRYDRYSNFGSTVNPRLAAIFSMTDRSTLKLLYGTAFRAPSEYELLPGVDRIGNSGLQPEEVKTFEVVLEHYFATNTRLTLAAYRNEFSRLIELEDDIEADQLVFRNSGRAISDGIELEFEHRWDRGQSLRASYAWQQAKNDFNHRQLRNSPTHLAKLNYSTPLFGETLRAGLEVQYVSSQKTIQYGTFDDDFPDYIFGKASSHTTVNLNLVTRRFDNGLQFKASILDLLDSETEHAAGKEHDQNVIPQDGRTFRLELNYRLDR